MEDKNVSQVKDTSEDESISDVKDKSKIDPDDRLVKLMRDYEEVIAQLLGAYHDDHDMLVTVDAATEKVTRCNKALTDTLGYGRQEIVGESIFNLYHRDGVKDAKELFRAITQTGAVRDVKQTLRKSDGSKLTVSLNATTVRDTDGKVTSAQLDWRDFTLRESELADLRAENRRFAARLRSVKLKHPEAFADIVTRDPVMHDVFGQVESAARTAKTVLITGETGVGKENIARIIHRLSGRQGECVSVNSGGLNDQLFSDTLFGRAKGAFTSADSDRQGLIARASGGTLFLDEIGDLSMDSQVKLLRLLQEGEYYRLGDDTPRTSDARPVVATNRTMDALLTDESFRDDLFYRLDIHHIHLPPLRERKADIPLLVAHFLDKAAREQDKHAPTPPPALFTLLGSYHFPGNIRELEGMVTDAVSQHERGVLSMDAFRRKMDEHTPAFSGDAALQTGAATFSEALSSLENLPTLKEMEEQLIAEALNRTDDNQTIAAGLLGLNKQTLNNRLRRARKSTNTS